MRQLFTRFLLFWATLKLWQKASLFAAAFLVLALLGSAVFFAGRTAYEPLFTGLDLEDQSSIVAYLRENKIPYKLDPAAQAILLPRNQVYEVRLSLAQEKLPKGGSSGFELFDDSKPGRSEFEQNIAYVRALEGELQRTIMQIEAVEYARVSIVMPKQPLFLEQERPSTASVLLRLKQGMRLHPDQISAVMHLVSRSVDRLEPDNVVVVDTQGAILSNLIDDDLFYYDGRQGITSKQRELERRHERDLERQARQMLEKAFGMDSVVVKVKVEMDFDKETLSVEEFSPNPDLGQGVPRSIQNMEENFSGQGKPTGGAPGTTTNIPGYAVETENVESEYSKSERTTNYEVNRRKSDKIATPGRVRRLTASVLVNGELEQERLNELRDLVAHAIGFDASRDDSLVVKSMPFSTALADALLEEMRKERMVRVTVGILIALFVLAVVGGTGYWWLRRRRARQALAEVQQESKHVPTIQEMLTSPDLLAFQGEMAVLEEQLKAYARNNPDEVANLVNEWMSSD